jgi:glucose-6-phosphate isomerase
MKILHRFCSEEVMTMLERMDTFPDEFIDTSKWDDFLPSGMYNRRFSLAERIVIDKRYEKLKKEYHPRRAREAIIKTLMREEGKSPSSLLTIKEITQQSLDILEKQLKHKHLAAGYVPPDYLKMEEK